MAKRMEFLLRIQTKEAAEVNKDHAGFSVFTQMETTNYLPGKARTQASDRCVGLQALEVP